METRKKTSVKINVPCISSKENKLETILFSDEIRPLAGWMKFVKNGYVKRVKDEDVYGRVLELSGAPDNVYIAAPEKLGESLGIRRRWFSLQVKPSRVEPFKFQVQCLDSTGIKRVFRFDSRFSVSKVTYLFTDVPFTWKPGWNNLDVDLKNLMKQAYSTDLSEIVRVHIHASCRLKRVFFSDVYLGDDGLPKEYKLISAHQDFKPQPLKEVKAK